MTHSNKLIHESSPYLLQHAHNPVDWYPWGPEALERAHKENKPILLSIGYAACHWCHVMAHESFEDEETAKLMNQLFINIKVDREERPDLDKVYQTTHYLLTQQGGGWPLTVFLTPDDLTPFFSGTYFPPVASYQRPAFKDVLQQLADIYQKHHQDIQQQHQELKKILNPPSPVISDVRLNQQPVQHALQNLQRSFDTVNGGFGTAPKFPMPSRLSFLLKTNSPIAIETLKQMAKGGIHDQLGGGFYRYAVDAAWRIPHFEKMLYDNAQLLALYVQAFKQTGDSNFAEVAHDIANWVMTHMQSPEGGYYSSLDADSEGEEGKYYVWDKSEIKSLLTPEEYNVVEKYYGLNQPANFERRWHFYIAESDVGHTLLASAKAKLLTAREQRIAPMLDTKILTAWNALMIKSMLMAGYFLDKPEYLHSAQCALSFIHDHLWKNQRLFATSKSHLPGYLDDYAFLLDALITSLQFSFNIDHLNWAIELVDTLLSHFYDPESGGFYFTANDHEQLLYRPKSFMDEVLPVGNAVAARSLQVLGYLLGETRYLHAAEKTLHAAWPLLTQYPAEHCELLLALQDYLSPPQTIIIRGKAAELDRWRKHCKNTGNYVFAIPDDAKELPGLLNMKKPQEKTCAYVCEGMECSRMIEELTRL